jgi:hypothetical protein
MKRLAFALALLLCLASIASAQKTSYIFQNYQLDSTSEIFCDTVTFATTPPEGMAQCSTGSAAEDGWIDTRQEDFKSVAILIDAISLTAGMIDVTLYGRVAVGQTPIKIGTTQMYTTTDGKIIVVPEALRQIRIGLVINGTDGVGDEDVSITYYGARRLN